MSIPLFHLSVRVPWHDAGWNGTVCSNPLENGSCMFLGRIHDGKNVEKEESQKGKNLHELDESDLPPCIGEKVHFMSPNAVSKRVNHPYAANKNNDRFYGHYQETTLTYPGHSFSVIPYNWMLKNPENNDSARASELSLDYDPVREPDLGFANVWVQQLHNQRALLEAFAEPIVPDESLVFVYAKNIPNVDSTSRVLIGVGKVSGKGELTEYDYDSLTPESFRSTLWERPIYHTIRDDNKNGFLLPYHQLFAEYEKDDSIDIDEFIAYAPSFEEFSYGSEWVSNDVAIESLLILLEKLKLFDQQLDDGDFEHQMRWIDDEISRLWDLRGPYPGLGAVLTGLKVKQGNLVAWAIDALVRDTDTDEVTENPWQYVEKLFKGDISFLPENIHPGISDTLSATWSRYSADERAFLELLSRMGLTNDQVGKVIDQKSVQLKRYLENPYLLYEKNRLEDVDIPFTVIDKAVFSDQKMLERFPLPQQCGDFDALDKRRIRALLIELLETAADGGHTLQTDSQVVTLLDSMPVQPVCNPSTRNLEAIEEFLAEECIRIDLLAEDDELSYYKLLRLEKSKKRIEKFVAGSLRRKTAESQETDWRGIVDQHFGSIDALQSDWYQQQDEHARSEKSVALNTLINSRLSVLIGPAGTGKTTLLNLFRQQPDIAAGSVLLLAPTGKARVNMGKDALTIAQFLMRLKRYDFRTGRYFLNPEGENATYATVIVDEASMLTEEQLAALLDSLSGVKRLILVGDFRQLPPIGAGRPFVDIVNYLREKDTGLAELKTLFRQLSKGTAANEESARLDVKLARWFSDDNVKKNDEDVFDLIEKSRDKNWGNLRLIEWHSPTHLDSLLEGIVDEEIERLLINTEGKTVRNTQANFSASLGSNYYMEKSNWSGFGIESAAEAEAWQILSPVKPAGYGTKVINQKIQKTYRGKTKEKAIFPGSFTTKSGDTGYNARKMPKPVGEDGMVYGDKVINVKNTTWNKPWQKTFNPKEVPEDQILNYMANGEIGLHIGMYGKWGSGARPVNIAFSSQPGYAYTFRDRDFKEEGDVQMELAYAITVHKSQGSGFRLVIFVLPNPCPVLSRELFYTALTRQEDRIVILHQGNFSDYRKYTSGEYSETGRRLTDLFSAPTIQQVNKKYYDTRHIQISAKGEFMISKSEVIIANMLHAKQVRYSYEAPLSDGSGITIHPDFTMADDDLGITYYWEHQGMLTVDDYRGKWEIKQEWYERNGIVERSKDPDAERQLILTRDMPNGGIDAKQISDLIDQIFEL